MSIEALRWAFNQDLSGSKKAVLLVLADHADQSETCYPAVKRIAYRAGVARATAFRALEELEAEGFIRVVGRERFNKSTTSSRYYLNLDHGVQVDPMRGDREVVEEEGVSPRDGGGLTVRRARSHSDTPKNPQENPHLISRGGAASEAPVVAAGSAVKSAQDDGQLFDAVAVVASASPAPKPSRRAPEVPLPDDWEPNGKHVALAGERGVVLAYEAQQFRLHAQTHERRARNWDAAFSMWLNKAKPAGKSVPTQSASGWMSPRSA